MTLPERKYSLRNNVPVYSGGVVISNDTNNPHSMLSTSTFQTKSSNNIIINTNRGMLPMQPFSPQHFSTQSS
jgi:hypothetical protein